MDRPIPRRFPSLDGLRGIAVLAVFVYHYGAGGTSTNPFIHALGLVGKLGWAGVTLFFLLSGFLITGILWDTAGTPHQWRNFIIRRALRIFPLYYGSLVLLLLVAAAQGKLAATLHMVWVPALFLQNIPGLTELNQSTRVLYLHHYWSLAAEEQFYLLWPLLLGRVRTRRQAAVLCASVFALSLIFRVAVWMMAAEPLRYEGFLLSRAGELALGGLLAIAYRSYRWEAVTRAVPPVTVVSGVCVALLAWGSDNDTGFGLCAMTIFLGSVLAWSLQPGLLQRLTSARWLRWLGGISYGVYIFHVLLLPLYFYIAFHLVGTASHTRFVAARWLVGGVLTVALAWLSFRFYESPFLRLKERFASHT